MEITINDDESLVISGFWDREIEMAKNVRPVIWERAEKILRDQTTLSDTDFATLKQWFCDSRIDMTRVFLAVENNTIACIKIDPHPKEAAEGQNQMISDEAENGKRISQSLLDRFDIKHSYLDNPEDMKQFQEEREWLQTQNKLLPGYRGV